MAMPLSSKLTDLNEFLIFPYEIVEYRLAFKDKVTAQVFVNTLREQVNLNELTSITLLDNQRLRFSIPANDAETTKKVVELMKGYFPQFEQPGKDFAMKRINGDKWEKIKLEKSICYKDLDYEFNRLIRADIDGSVQYYVGGYNQYDYFKDGQDRNDPNKVRFFNPSTSHLEKREGGYYEMVPSENVPKIGVFYQKL